MFRFTIRDVLWVMVVVAMGVGWWLDNKRIETTLESERRAMKADFDHQMRILDYANKDASDRVMKAIEYEKRNSNYPTNR